MKLRFANLKVACLLFILSASALAAPGDFDPSFGYGGAMQFGTAYSFYFEGSAYTDPPHCCVLAQQADGKLLMAGATDESPARLVLRRFNTNGTLDTSYGFQGEAVGSFVYPGSFAYGIPSSIKSLSNGKTIVAGYFLFQGVKVFVVERFTSAGDLDTTFGNDGVITRPYSYDNAAVSLAEYSGTIYAASSRRIYCINSDGSSCHAFGLGFSGYISVPGISRVAIQPGTNRLLAAGDGWVRRYSLSGQLDTGFGNSGQAYTCTPSCDGCQTKTELAVRSNGKIVTAASIMVSDFSLHFFTLSLLNSNGSADPVFGGNGCSGDESGFPPFGEDGTPRGLEVQTDGKVVLLLGPPQQPDASINENWNVVRFNSDGTIDSSFAAQGTIARNQDLLVQSDGKIVTVGSTYNSSWRSLSNIFLGRYLP